MRKKKRKQRVQKAGSAVLDKRRCRHNIEKNEERTKADRQTLERFIRSGLCSQEWDERIKWGPILIPVWILRGWVDGRAVSRPCWPGNWGKKAPPPLLLRHPDHSVQSWMFVHLSPLSISISRDYFEMSKRDSFLFMLRGVLYVIQYLFIPGALICSTKQSARIGLTFSTKINQIN